jgi:hypothetical protein
VVHKLRDLYQDDQVFAKMFSKSGQSEICGPTSLTNVMLYLKHDHSPKYPNLFGHLPDTGEAKPVVEWMFNHCHTNRNTGTSSSQLVDCASSAMKQAGYDATLHHSGAFAADASLRKPVGPAEIHAQGHNAGVLLFGWYHRNTYKRDGGHFVALAGYDAKHPETVYVTNPLINNYPKDHVYSKVVLERVKGKHGDLPLDGMWQTEHLFGDNAGVIGVLEDLVSVLPK